MIVWTTGKPTVNVKTYDCKILYVLKWTFWSGQSCPVCPGTSVSYFLRKKIPRSDQTAYERSARYFKKSAAFKGKKTPPFDYARYS